MPLDESLLQRAGETLRGARRVLALTGAGVSAESGVPTFRGPGGYWRKHRAEELATPEAFRRDPLLVWEWYNSRRQNLLTLEPNPGHHALAELERRLESRFLLITQNVDGLHQRAGSRRVEVLHGDLWTTRCTLCGDVERRAGQIYDELPPRCGLCGGTLRPAVVWFGEYLPMEPLERIDAFVRAPEPIDAMLLVGTTALIHYVQTWALMLKRGGAMLIEVNPDETVLTDSADLALRGASGEVLPALMRAAFPA